MKTFKEFQTVIEGYKEPNIERMKRQAGRHLSTNHIDLSREIDRLSRGKKIDSTIGYPDKPIYFRDKEGIPRRNVRHDVASFRGLENYLNKQNANRVRKGKNIQAKIQQYHNDPLGYMSRTFGGPHIDTGMDMKRRPRKKVNEGYKEPNVERMRLKAQYHNNMAGTLGYAMNPLNREKQNLYRGRKNFVSRYDSNAPKAYHRDNKTGKVQRGADINDLESIHRYEKRQSKLLKNRFDRHSRSAKNIQAKIDQHQNDPLSYMSRAMGGPHADDNMDMKRRPTKKKVQEAYMEIYGKDLNESLADMFAAAYDDLNKEAQKHASESQKRLKAIKKKMADAQQEIARQDAEIDTGMDMKRRPRKKVNEGYKEPNVERMKKQADKFSDYAKTMKGYYKWDHDYSKDDIERIYKRKKPHSYHNNSSSNKAYTRDSRGRIERGEHPGDLLSLQNKRKFDIRHHVDRPERKARNIRAKIQQHQNDPLGYMSRTFGGPHIDTGMDMKRRPRKRK